MCDSTTDYGDAGALVRTPTARSLAAGVLASCGGDLDCALALLARAREVLIPLLDTRPPHERNTP